MSDRDERLTKAMGDNNEWREVMARYGDCETINGINGKAGAMAQSIVTLEAEFGRALAHLEKGETLIASTILERFRTPKSEGEA